MHQVVKPLLAPTRLFYDEKVSKVPNLFQIRKTEGGSHFTGLRLLRYLTIGQDPLSPAFVSMAEARSFFAETFGSDADFIVWVDRFLASNMIEASTRQDSFSEDVDALRITTFGQFVLNELYTTFTYVDLICTDCGMRSESHCNALVNLANSEVQLFQDKRRLERVKKRLEKAEVFINYLSQEEEQEVAFFSLQPAYEFMPALRANWDLEKPRIISSAQRNQ